MAHGVYKRWLMQTVGASRSSHQCLLLHRLCHRHITRKIEWKPAFPFWRGSRRLTDKRRPYGTDTYQSIVETSASDATAALRRGICRRKFPVAKMHDLYIGIRPSTSQRANCFQTTGRTVCQRLFAQRPHDAYSSIHNPSFQAGRRECVFGNTSVSRQFTDLSKSELAPYSYPHF